MQWQRSELAKITDVALDSDEIEYGMIVQMCEKTLANPDFAASVVLPRIEKRLKTGGSGSLTGKL